MKTSQLPNLRVQSFVRHYCPTLSVALAIASIFFAAAAPADAQCTQFTVLGSHGGSNPLRTSFHVTAGQHFELKAYGSINWTTPGGTWESPRGRSNSYSTSYWLPSSQRFALIGQIGNTVFEVGEHWNGPAPATGELLLGVNDDIYGDNRGSFEVFVMPCDPGPMLSLSDPEPNKPLTIDVEFATPNGLVAFAASLAGAGPTNTSCGPLAVSRPYKSFVFRANSSGRAIISRKVPNIVGRTNVWMQAVDLSTCELTLPTIRTVNP